MGHRNMGMRQEQDLHLSQDMGLAMITLNDISRIVGETSPLRQVKVNADDITRYLRAVNDIMFEQKLPSEEIRSNYLTALAIYTFAAPVAGMELDTRVRDNFVHIARKKLDIADPLTVYFRAAQTDDQEDVTATVQKGLVEVGKTALPRLFKATTHVQRDVVSLVNDSLSRLQQHGHNYSRHFRFAGAYAVCAPLFGAKVENDDAHKKDSELRDNHGTFELQGPE